MKIADIIKTFVSGDWGNEIESQESPCKVSCIRGADIELVAQFEFHNIPIRYISKKSLEGKALQEGDIVIEKSGGSPTQSTGRVVYISQQLIDSVTWVVCSNFCMAFRVKPEWNAKYVYYYLQYIYNQGAFYNFEGKTSGIKNLQLETAFKSIPIAKISLTTQNRIVSILSNIDQKIALNRAINHNLPKLDRSSRGGEVGRAA
jgi:type I restriction enzyme S subunit